MGTKENLLKWADEQYKNSSQSYEKIVRKPRTCLAKAEREEIARFITKNKYDSFPVSYFLAIFFQHNDIGRDGENFQRKMEQGH